MSECGVVGSATRCSACPILRHSESGPLDLSVCECGATGSASGQTACPVGPTLRQSQCHHGQGVLSTPVPVSAPPTGLDVSFLFIYLVSDFPALRFSVSSGCARRCSVSTYAAILVLYLAIFFKFYTKEKVNHKSTLFLFQIFTLSHHLQKPI